MHFNPAGLLSVGDALAFSKALMTPPAGADQFASQVGEHSHTFARYSIVSKAITTPPAGQDQFASQLSKAAHSRTKRMIPIASSQVLLFWADQFRVANG